MARCWCADGFEITCGESCRDHGGDCQKKCWDGSRAEQCDPDQGCPPCQRHCADGTIAPDCNLDACESGRCEQQSWIDEDTGCLMRYTADCVPEQECPEGSSCTASDGTGRTACGHVDDCEDCHCTPDHPWSGSSCQYECREGLFRPGHEDGCGTCLPSCTSSIPCQVIDDGVVKKGHLNTCCECIPESCTPGGGCTTAEGGKGTRQSDCSCKPDCVIDNTCRTGSGVIGKMDKNCNCVGDCTYHGGCGTRKWYDKDCNCICNNISKMSPCTTSGGSWGDDCACDCPDDMHLSGDRCVCDACGANRHHPKGSCACVCNDCGTNAHHPSGSCACVCNDCPSGQHHPSGSCDCVCDSCGANMHHPAGSCSCVCDDCQEGYHHPAGSCSCEPDDCPSCGTNEHATGAPPNCGCECDACADNQHQTGSAAAGTCKCECNDCEEGKHHPSGSCDCVCDDCQEGFVHPEGSCACECENKGDPCAVGDTTGEVDANCDCPCTKEGQDCTLDNGEQGKYDGDCKCVCVAYGQECYIGQYKSGQFNRDCECECASAGESCTIHNQDDGEFDEDCNCNCARTGESCTTDDGKPGQINSDCECVCDDSKQEPCELSGGTWKDCACDCGEEKQLDDAGQCECKDQDAKNDCETRQAGGENVKWNYDDCTCECDTSKTDSECQAEKAGTKWGGYPDCKCVCSSPKTDAECQAEHPNTKWVEADCACDCQEDKSEGDDCYVDGEKGTWKAFPRCECVVCDDETSKAQNCYKTGGSWQHETCSCDCSNAACKTAQSDGSCKCDSPMVEASGGGCDCVLPKKKKESGDCGCECDQSEKRVCELISPGSWNPDTCKCCSETTETLCKNKEGESAWNATTCDCTCRNTKHVWRLSECKCPDDAAETKCGQTRTGTWDPDNCECKCTSETLMKEPCKRTGGKWNSSDNPCECTCGENKKTNNRGECVCDSKKESACTTGGKGTWDSATCTCTCKDGHVLNAEGKCVCPNNSKEFNCSDSGGDWDKDENPCKCTCPTLKPLDAQSGRCKCDDDSGKAACEGGDSGGRWDTKGHECDCDCSGNPKKEASGGVCVCTSEAESSATPPKSSCGAGNYAGATWDKANCKCNCGTMSEEQRECTKGGKKGRLNDNCVCETCDCHKGDSCTYGDNCNGEIEVDCDCSSCKCTKTAEDLQCEKNNPPQRFDECACGCVDDECDGSEECWTSGTDNPPNTYGHKKRVGKDCKCVADCNPGVDECTADECTPVDGRPCKKNTACVCVQDCDDSGDCEGGVYNCRTAGGVAGAYDSQCTCQACCSPKGSCTTTDKQPGQYDKDCNCVECQPDETTPCKGDDTKKWKDCGCVDKCEEEDHGNKPIEGSDCFGNHTNKDCSVTCVQHAQCTEAAKPFWDSCKCECTPCPEQPELKTCQKLDPDDKCHVVDDTDMYEEGRTGWISKRNKAQSDATTKAFKCRGKLSGLSITGKFDGVDVSKCSDEIKQQYTWISTLNDDIAEYNEARDIVSQQKDDAESAISDIERIPEQLKSLDCPNPIPEVGECMEAAELAAENIKDLNQAYDTIKTRIQIVEEYCVDKKCKPDNLPKCRGTVTGSYPDCTCDCTEQEARMNADEAEWRKLNPESPGCYAWIDQANCRYRFYAKCPS